MILYVRRVGSVGWKVCHDKGRKLHFQDPIGALFSRDCYCIDLKFNPPPPRPVPRLTYTKCALAPDVEEVLVRVRRISPQQQPYKQMIFL